MGIFVVRKYRGYCISSKYQQYRTAGNRNSIETERIESPGIKYRKQLVSASVTILSVVLVLAKH